MNKIARVVKKAVELVSTIPLLEFINDIVDVDIADPDPTKISVIIDNTFFLFKPLCFFLYYSFPVLRDFKMFS